MARKTVAQREAEELAEIAKMRRSYTKAGIEKSLAGCRHAIAHKLPTIAMYIADYQRRVAIADTRTADRFLELACQHMQEIQKYLEAVERWEAALKHGWHQPVAEETTAEAAS